LAQDFEALPSIRQDLFEERNKLVFNSLQRF
jgi:hypothetical protein